jgi:hypothetical protein
MCWCRCWPRPATAPDRSGRGPGLKSLLTAVQFVEDPTRPLGVPPGGTQQMLEGDAGEEVAVVVRPIVGVADLLVASQLLLDPFPQRLDVLTRLTRVSSPRRKTRSSTALRCGGSSSGDVIHRCGSARPASVIAPIVFSYALEQGGRPLAAAAILAAGLIGAAVCMPLARVLHDADRRRPG